MNTNRHLAARLFLSAFALLAAQEPVHGEPANTMVGSSDLPSAVKRDDSVLAQQAVAALEQLKAAVLVYRSYGEFETDGRVARVPLVTFTDKFDKVTAEVESILSQLSDAKLKSHLSNSLYSYRDGAFWWARLDLRKVVTTDNPYLGFTPTTPVDRFLVSTVPYTVVIHWRQANKYLLRAQRLIAEANASVPVRSR